MRRRGSRILRIGPVAGLCALAALAGCGHGSSSPDQGQTARSMLRLGDHMRANGDLASAAAFYRQAAGHAAGDPATLLLTGEMLAEIHATEDAIGVYRLALAAAPEDSSVRSHLGRALLGAGRTEESIEMLQYALKADDADAASLLNLGAAFDLSGQPGKAAEAYRRGLEIEPGNLDLKSNLALSLALVDQFAPAIELMEEVALSPLASDQHHRNLVLVFALAGLRPEHVNLHRHLSEGEVERLRRQAQWVQTIEPTSARARAVGTAAVL